MKKITFLLALLCAFATANAYDFKVDGLCYKFETGTNVKVTPGENYATTLTGELNIPGEVTYNGTTYNVNAIDDHTFEGCTGITSVNLPDGIQSIFQNAFSNCENLASIHLPSNLKTIGFGAFEYCTSLTSITIPASVVSISGKGQINIPNRGPVFGCDNLETIVVEEGNQYYDSRDNCNAIIETATNTLIFGCKGSTFPAGVIIGKGAFKECSMTSLDIPEGVTTIEEDAFNSCHNLETVTLQSVTFIGQFAFSYCNKLKTVTLPASLDSISQFAFLDCSSLADIYAFPAGGDVGLGGDVWVGVPQADCNLHVYPEDYEYYSTADQWKDFNVVADLDAQNVYILGEVGENNWAPNVGQQMVYDANTQLYTADITCDGRNSGYNYFSFTTELAENNDDGGWAYIAPFRFGAVSNGDFEVTDQWLGKELSLTYDNGQAYKIPQGEYKLSLDLENMKLVITKNNAYAIGDVDGDGKVDVTDVNIVVNIILGKDNATNYNGRADVNGADGVDVSDVNAIVNIILGKTN